MSAKRTELKNIGYEIFIGALSLLSIFNLVLIAFAPRGGALDEVMLVMNAIFSGIFLIDFSYRLATAPSRSAYFFRHFGWADLLASLPFAQLKFLRIFRLVRVFRLLRQVGGRTVLRRLVRDRAGSALYTLLFTGILVLQFGSMAVLRVEIDAPGANITDASDALWYTIATISTVGYGDRYPVTNAGRVIGSMIIVVGVGIFGTFTGYLANIFLTPRKAAARPAGSPEDPLERLRAVMALPGATLTDVDRVLGLQRDAPPGDEPPVT
ncbi:ion transporter [Cellulomonas sp. P5_E12]